MRFVVTLAAVVLTLGVAAIPIVSGQTKPASAPPNADLVKLVEGNNEFAFDLYRRLAKKDGNIIFSPYSISTALAMTYAGARGETAEEMASVLHFGLPAERVHTTFAELTQRLQAQEKQGHDHQLEVANALWGQEGWPFRDSFVDLVKRRYRAELRTLDFINTPEEARQTINDWTRRHTRDKIEELLAKGFPNARTRLILTNAVYFQADWGSPFGKVATREQPFRLPSKQEVAVPMMRQVLHGPHLVRYGEIEGAQILELAYKGGAISFLVVLPSKADGLPKLEGSMNGHRLQAWRASLLPSPESLKSLTDEHLKALLQGESLWPAVDVTLPQIKVTSDCSLADHLMAMGMARAFSARDADLAGMVEGPRIYLQAVIHKAYLELNEQGSVAAAATAVVAGTPIAMPLRARKTVSFRADHPFLYFILDNQAGSLLFFGRVVDPRS